MKKKINVFLLIAILILTVAATGCGKGQNIDSGNTSLSSVSTSNTDNSTEKHESDEAEGNTSSSTEIVEEEPATEPDKPEETTDTAFPSNSGRLHVEGTNICNENNEIVQLKGLSTHGIAWYPDYVNNSLFGEFRNDWNCNVIRLAMYTDEYAGYCNGGDKTALRKLIDNGVKYATDNDMYVIIDWHILADADPNIHKDEALKFFEDVSASYADYNNVIYEICNEPNGGTEWKRIKAYAEEVISVIRKNDENAIIIVGTPTWSQEVDKAAENPITGYDNIMYALHFYADTHKEDLRNKMVAAINAGLPIFVTEYGICDASGNGAINTAEAEKWMDVMNKYNISSCAWNISNKDETSAIFKSSVSKTSGFSESDLSDSGKWLFKMLSAELESGNGGGKKENNEQKDNPDKKDNSDDKKDDPKTISDGKISYTIREENSWESGGEMYHQYSVTIENNGSDVSEWSIDVTFSDEIKLDNKWCGAYSINGNVLTIKNESYNGFLAQGDSTKDIGFIVIGKPGLTIK